MLKGKLKSLKFWSKNLESGVISLEYFYYGLNTNYSLLLFGSIWISTLPNSGILVFNVSFNLWAMS